MTGNLTPAQIEDLIQQQHVARLACCINNKPYIVPINYMYDGAAIYGRTGDGMKISIMRKNPQVCILVDDIKTLTHWKSVIAWGRFKELTDAAERETALQKLHEVSVVAGGGEHFRLNPEWPFTPADMSKVSGVVYKIELDEKSGRFEEG